MSEQTKDQKDAARRAAETRRIESRDGKSSNGAKNAPGQATHGQEEPIHAENMDRETDDLYDTEADNEVTEWKRHSDLQAPAARAGYVNRFIRVRLGTVRDTARLRNAMREGWRPVKASAVPSRSLPTTHLDGYGEVIGVEDLILCEMPEKVFEQRQAFYRRKLHQQNMAIERQLSKESRDDVSGFGPIEQTRKTSVSQSAPRTRVAMVADDD